MNALYLLQKSVFCCGSLVFFVHVPECSISFVLKLVLKHVWKLIKTRRKQTLDTSWFYSPGRGIKALCDIIITFKVKDWVFSCSWGLQCDSYKVHLLKHWTFIPELQKNICMYNKTVPPQLHGHTSTHRKMHKHTRQNDKQMLDLRLKLLKKTLTINYHNRTQR